MSILVVGAGAFGTSLAISLGRKGRVSLWARDPQHIAEMQATRRNTRRLPGANFPDALTVTATLQDAQTVLLAVPAQKLSGVLTANRDLFAGKYLVACCKGIDRETGLGACDTIAAAVSTAIPAVLTGPSFAADLAVGLPTALTLACADKNVGRILQKQLSTPVLRLYRTTDTKGAELGGALKNVMAIACGVAIGAGLGHSARAALMTRGFAEMTRFAVQHGADSATLSGLSGFGDLALTCTSEGSRNYQFGVALGSGQSFDPNTTVEGASTALAMKKIALHQNLDMPITQTVARLVEKKADVQSAIEHLLSRPLKEE